MAKLKPDVIEWILILRKIVFNIFIKFDLVIWNKNATFALSINQ